MGLKDNLRDLWTIMKYNLKIETRYPISYVSSILNLLFWFLAFATLVLMFSSPTSPREYVITCNLIAWGLASYILFSGIMGEVGYGIIRLQRRGTLEQILLAPISYWILPLGLAAFELVISAIFMAVTILLMAIIFDAPIIIGNPLGGFVAFLLFFGMVYGVAMLLAGVSITTKRSSWAFGNALSMLYMIFCGTFYSFSSLPGQILAISRLIPLSYGVDLFRTTLIGIDPELINGKVDILGYSISGALLEWAIVSLLSIMMLLIGYICLISAIKRGKIKGYLGQY